MCICGDFNARCGSVDDLGDVDREIPPRNILDHTINTHGQQLLDCLRATGLCILNGRGKDNFTYVSTLGCSVVDYCLVLRDDFHSFSDFSVQKMSDLVKKLNYEDHIGIPDHSLLTWSINFDWIESLLSPSSPVGVSTSQVKSIISQFDYYKIPDNFLAKSRLQVEVLTDKLLEVQGDEQQSMLDDIYIYIFLFHYS